MVTKKGVFNIAIDPITIQVKNSFVGIFCAILLTYIYHYLCLLNDIKTNLIS